MHIKEVSKLTGLSVKALQYFDSLQLLSPNRNENNYRVYNSEDLEKLQIILFFRELEFPLKQIAKILTASNYNKQEALNDQIKLLKVKRDRIELLIKLAQKNLQGDIFMNDNLDTNFSVFDNTEFENLEAEAKLKWGNTQAYKECDAKLKNQSKEEIKMKGNKMMQIFKEFGTLHSKNLTTNKTAMSHSAQVLVKKLQDFITVNYYTCDNTALLNLGEMYVNDDRFTANIDTHGGPGTAKFVNETIKAYVEQK